MESLELDELHMSGTRAVFKHSERLRKGDIVEAFEEQGMELISYRRERRSLPKVLYKIDTGIT